MSIQPVGMIPEWTRGDRLRKAREARDLSQSALARRLEISPKTVGNYELDRVRPQRIVLRAWSMATGVPLQWLETGEAPSPDGDGASESCTPRDSNPEPADFHSGRHGVSRLTLAA